MKHGGVDKQRAERIKKNIIRLNNQRKATKKLRLKQELNAELRQANIERMKRGEKPKYYNNRMCHFSMILNFMIHVVLSKSSPI